VPQLTKTRTTSTHRHPRAIVAVLDPDVTAHGPLEELRDIQGHASLFVVLQLSPASAPAVHGKQPEHGASCVSCRANTDPHTCRF